MKNKVKSTLSMFMTFIFMLTCMNIISVKTILAKSNLLNDTNTSINKVHNFVLKNGTWSSDWKTVAFNKSGLKLPNNFNQNYLKSVEKLLKDSKGKFYKVTDYERVTLGVVAAGGDPRNIGGYNLLDKIYNFYDSDNPKRKIDFQGLNGVIYGLIALDTKNYPIPKGAKFNREYMLDYILNNRNSDGGWDLNMNGERSDVDITSMTLISLAPYHNYVTKDGKKVSDAIIEAVNWLSKVQRKDGGFNSWSTQNNSESCSQTIIGLCANGIDPTSSKFTKDINLIENLLKFQQSNGEFYHLLDGSKGVNGMSTEQAYQAMLAYRDFVNKKGSIYWFDGKKMPTTFKDLSKENNITKSDESKVKQDVVVNKKSGKVIRVCGTDRFETCINVAKHLKSKIGKEKFKNIIVSSGFGFADSLSGSVLAKKLNAPIILVGNTLNSSNNAINYIKDNLEKDGVVYILGGYGSVSSDIENNIKEKGYAIKRLSGTDRFDTCNSVVKEFSPKQNTPLVIVNGLSFPDALSVSAPASINGYPILLSEKGKISSYIEQLIKSNKPSKIFLIGGEGVLSTNINKQIKAINSEIDIVRIAGKDRYDTSLKVNEYFKNNKAVLLASGSNYPDALSGVSLAGQMEGSLLLANDSTIKSQMTFIDKEKTKEVVVLGGEGAINKKVELIVNSIFN